MKRYWVYFKAVVRHKWFVYTAWRDLHKDMPVNLLWIVLHDWDKFMPGEFIPYARSFYNPDGTSRNLRDSTGNYEAARVGGAFDQAWLLHQKRNKHHWQWWVLPLDDGGVKPLKMGLRHSREMIMDWVGAERSYGGTTPVWEWYESHKDKMLLEEYTRMNVEMTILSIQAKWGGL